MCWEHIGVQQLEFVIAHRHMQSKQQLSSYLYKGVWEVLNNHITLLKWKTPIQDEDIEFLFYVRALLTVAMVADKLVFLVHISLNRNHKCDRITHVLQAH